MLNIYIKVYNMYKLSDFEDSVRGERVKYYLARHILNTTHASKNILDFDYFVRDDKGNKLGSIEFREEE